MARVFAYFGGSSRFVLMLATIILVMTVAILDHETGPTVSVSIFYVLAVGMGCWFVGTRFGVVVAILATVSWFIADRLHGTSHLSTWIFYWNSVVRLLLFASVVWLLTVLHTFYQQLESVVQERTATLRGSETRLRLLTQRVPAILWSTDRDQKFTFSAGTGLSALHVRPEQIEGMSLAEFFGTHDPNFVHTARHREALTGKAVNYEGAWHGREMQVSIEPLIDENGQTIGTIGVALDITERKHLENEILRISEREQQRIGQDLHDSLCQHLTATMFASKVLEERLASKSLPESKAAQQIVGLLSASIGQARTVARGLSPVSLQEEGLTEALRELADHITTSFKIPCSYRAMSASTFHDHNVAVHLYRIAQEAVNNAVRHAEASSIEISLLTGDGRMELAVEDDGVGMPANNGTRDGMGMHTMRYRAGLIGGTLSITPLQPRGTRVVCTLPITSLSVASPS